MLKDIANKAKAKPSETALAFLTVEQDTVQSVDLPLLQKNLVARIQECGGQVKQSELPKDVHSHTVNSLLDKGVIKAKLVDGDAILSLADGTVHAKDSVEVPVGGMSATELRDAMSTYLGKFGQVKLASILGVNPGTVRKWAQGVNAVPRHVVVFFAMLEHMDAHDVPAPEFVEPTHSVGTVAA